MPIGQIPLEGLDFTADPVGQRLIGNPQHDGEHMIDVLSDDHALLGFGSGMGKRCSRPQTTSLVTL